MARTVRTVRQVARKQSSDAIKILARILRSRRTPAISRVAAANALLDRGWGRPKPIPREDDEADGDAEN